MPGTEGKFIIFALQTFVCLVCIGYYLWSIALLLCFKYTPFLPNSPTAV